MNDLPPITSDELKTLVLAFEEGLPGEAANPLIAKGLLMRCPPHTLLTETGRAILMQHALYKPFLVQSYTGARWIDCGRTWTETGAMTLMARLNLAFPPRHWRILDEDRKVIFTTETYSKESK
jgi:hypothetical protein